MSPEIQRHEHAEGVYEAGANLFRQSATEPHGNRSFTVALAGGSTPRGLYTRLADDAALRTSIPWTATDFFWSDERNVPPGHAQSNYRMAHEALLAKVGVPPARVHRIRGEQDAHAAAAAYEQEVRSFFEVPEGIPRFDLMLLGLGADGHTASLFPDSAALTEDTRLVSPNWVATLDAYRLTMTLPLINAARRVVFLVTGSDKADAVRRVLEPDAGSPTLPAQLVRPVDGQLIWLLDRDAASLLAR